MDYSGGICHQPLIYDMNTADPRSVYADRNAANTGPSKCDDVPCCSYNNTHGMYWCRQHNQLQYYHNECANHKVETEQDREQQMCENILHGAVEKLKKRKKENVSKCGKLSTAGGCNFGGNCAWYPQACQAPESAACCNLIREEGCQAKTCAREARNDLQTIDQVQCCDCLPQTDKWCEISQKSLEICDLPTNPKQTENFKNSRQLQANCQYCDSNQQFRNCNQNSCEMAGTTNQCPENIASMSCGTEANQDCGNVYACNQGKPKKFPTAKIKRRFFILTSNELNEEVETPPCFCTDLSDQNSGKELPKKKYQRGELKKRLLNRLQAGSARYYNRKTKLKNSLHTSELTDEESLDTLADESEEVTKIIYHICMKDKLHGERKCKCNNCLKANYRKSFKSKIPRLVANYHSEYKSQRDVTCACSNYEVFGKNYF